MIGFTQAEPIIMIIPTSRGGGTFRQVVYGYRKHFELDAADAKKQ